MTYTATCQQYDFDPLTNTCRYIQWVQESGVLPPLSINDAMLISGLIAGLWVSAYCFKFIRKFLFK